MRTYWDAYLNQFSEEYIQTRTLREHLEGFHNYLEGIGALLYYGEGHEKLRKLEKQNKDLREVLKYIDKQIETLKTLKGDIEENGK